MLRATSVYPDKEGKAPSSSRLTRPERRGVSNVRIIEPAKEKVSTFDLADRLAADQGSRWRSVGDERITNCVLPDHDDRTPSFTVNREKNVWFCHGCVRGGDVIELARFAWGYEKHGVAMAAADLLHEFGHPIPERPASWFKKQVRQKPARDALEAAKILHLQRRVFRIFQPMIEEIEDEGARREEAQYLWDAAGEIAVCLWAGRRAA